jgi:hypothetical protein
MHSAHSCARSSPNRCGCHQPLGHRQIPRSDQTSTLFAGTHARGAANSFLGISECGFVQCEDLRRSEEILTGALPSAKDGTIVVETTWRGEREGIFGTSSKRALKRPKSRSSPMIGG